MRPAHGAGLLLVLAYIVSGAAAWICVVLFDYDPASPQIVLFVNMTALCATAMLATAMGLNELDVVFWVLDRAARLIPLGLGLWCLLRTWHNTPFWYEMVICRGAWFLIGALITADLFISREESDDSDTTRDKRTQRKRVQEARIQRPAHRGSHTRDQ